MPYRVTPLDGRNTKWSGLTAQETAQLLRRSVASIEIVLEYNKGKAEFDGYLVEDETAADKK